MGRRSDPWDEVQALTILDLAAKPYDELRTTQRKIAEALRLAEPSARRLAPAQRADVTPNFKGDKATKTGFRR